MATAKKRGREDDEGADSKRTRYEGNFLPAARGLTRYSHIFGKSDDELFNQEPVFSGDLSRTREIRSGLTPTEYPTDAPVMSPLAFARQQELQLYQRFELSVWDVSELADMEAIEAVVKPSNLSNGIHPILDRGRWQNPDPKVLGAGTPEYYTLSNGKLLEVTDPDVWLCMVPSLRLASQFIANLHVFEWWDALWEGRREDFTHSDELLTRFFKRNEEHRLERPVQLEKHLHEITWVLSVGKTSDVKFFDGCTWDYSERKASIAISGGLIEPLLQTGDAKLSPAQKLTQDFYVANVILHELSHAVGIFRNAHTRLPPEIGSVKDDPPMTRTVFDRTPGNVTEMYYDECFQGELTEQEAQTAFKRRWQRLAAPRPQNETPRSAEELWEELLKSKEYWNSINQLRREKHFKKDGTTIYETITTEFQPRTRTEQYITKLFKDRHEEKYHDLLGLTDHFTGRDWITAILQLRSENFFIKPKVCEQYYMDEDVAENGFSMANCALGGQLSRTPVPLRDARHRYFLDKALKGFTDWTTIRTIEDWKGNAYKEEGRLDPTKSMPIYAVILQAYPVYSEGGDRLYKTSPILNPKKFGDPTNIHTEWPIPLSFIEELQQDDFWKVVCAQYGGEMVKMNPKLLGRQEKPKQKSKWIIDSSCLTPSGAGQVTEDNKYKELKMKNSRRIASRLIERGRQNWAQFHAIQKAMSVPTKKLEADLFFRARESERISFYGRLATQVTKQQELETALKLLNVGGEASKSTA